MPSLPTETLGLTSRAKTEEEGGYGFPPTSLLEGTSTTVCCWEPQGLRGSWVQTGGGPLVSSELFKYFLLFQDPLSCDRDTIPTPQANMKIHSVPYMENPYSFCADSDNRQLLSWARLLITFLSMELICPHPTTHTH